MSEILDDLNISSLKINDALNFGGKFVGSIQASLEGGNSAETATVVSTSTLITTLNIASDTKYISLASGTVGQMKIIVVTQGTQGNATIQLNIIDNVFNNVNYNYTFSDTGDAITLIYTTEGWVIINSVVID